MVKRIALAALLLAGSTQAQPATPATQADACYQGIAYDLRATTFPDKRFLAFWDFHPALIPLPAGPQWQCIGFGRYISFGYERTDVVAVWINPDGSLGAAVDEE